MTAHPLKGQVVFEKKIAITMRRECSMYWRLSKTVRLQTEAWEVTDTRLATLMRDMKMSSWLSDKLAELQALNKKRATP